MGLEHCDEYSMLFDVLSVFRFLDVCLLLAHLADQIVWFWIWMLCKLLLHAIFLDETVFDEVYCRAT
jgi:hypothetical protein